MSRHRAAATPAPSRSSCWRPKSQRRPRPTRSSAMGTSSLSPHVDNSSDNASYVTYVATHPGCAEPNCGVRSAASLITTPRASQHSSVGFTRRPVVFAQKRAGGAWSAGALATDCQPYQGTRAGSLPWRPRKPGTPDARDLLSRRNNFGSTARLHIEYRPPGVKAAADLEIALRLLPEHTRRE
jgi:hypothetical protein